MSLVNQAVLQSLPRFTTSGTDPLVFLKFYGPDSALIWFVSEGQEENGEFRFWGIKVDPYAHHWGYFTLRELEQTTGPEGAAVVCDERFLAQPVSQLPELLDYITRVSPAPKVH